MPEGGEPQLKLILCLSMLHKQLYIDHMPTFYSEIHYCEDEQQYEYMFLKKEKQNIEHRGKLKKNQKNNNVLVYFLSNKQTTEFVLVCGVFLNSFKIDQKQIRNGCVLGTNAEFVDMIFKEGNASALALLLTIDPEA